MKITFYKANTNEFYSIDFVWLETGNKVFIDNHDNEGGSFDADEITDIIYNAIDKYFKENL